MGWFRRKRKEEPIEKQNTSQVEHKQITRVTEMTCPFCAKSFAPEELVFAIEGETGANAKPDQVYQDFVNKNFLPSGKNLIKKWLFAENWSMDDVVVWEDGDPQKGVPLYIQSRFTWPSQKVVGEDNTIDDLGLDEAIQDEDEGLEATSTARLCPYCHCQLPEGTGVNRVIRIGLYGGKRSGKTTYMTIAAVALENRFNHLALGEAKVVSECKDVKDYLYQQARNYEGCQPTVKGKPSFPMVLTIRPNDQSYDPFFLVFQDIPGEIAEGGRTTLINHPFTKSHAFLGIVDINMFIETNERAEMRHLRNNINQLMREKDKWKVQLENAQNSESKKNIEAEIQKVDTEISEINVRMNMLENLICTARREEVFGNMPFGPMMKDLRSVQIMLTKIDMWLATSQVSDELGDCSEIAHDHTEDHSLGISAKHLEYTDAQVRGILPEEMKAMDGSSMIEWAAGKLAMAQNNVPMAYTAVTSRLNLDQGLTGSDDAYKDSMNILDPILNVCMWEHVLPVKR